MYRLVQLLIVSCALIVCLTGCSSDDAAKENASNVTKLDTTKSPAAQGMRKPIAFGGGKPGGKMATAGGGGAAGAPATAGDAGTAAPPAAPATGTTGG